MTFELSQTLVDRPADVRSAYRRRIVEASRKLRVLVISDALAGRNGVGTYYEDLVAQLRPFVERINLVAPHGNPRSDHERFSLPLPGDTTQRVCYPRVHRLRRLMNRESPHVVILPSLGAYTYFGLQLARRANCGVCVAHHTNFDTLAQLYWPRVLASPCRRALRMLTNRLLGNADSVVTVNVESMRDAKQRGAQQARIVGTPLATLFLTTPPRPLNPELRRVVFIGRLAEEKGVRDLLHAAKAMPETSFTFGGDGPLRAKVELAARTLSNVRYLGWLSRLKVLHAIDDADLLALPSEVETFGTVALEALARRRLVLVNRNGGIMHWPDLAEGIFAINPHESAAQAIRRLQHMSADNRCQIAAQGWKAVESFNDETLHGWLSVLVQTAQPRPRKRTRNPSAASARGRSRSLSG